MKRNYQEYEGGIKKIRPEDHRFADLSSDDNR